MAAVAISVRVFIFMVTVFRCCADGHVYAAHQFNFLIPHSSIRSRCSATSGLVRISAGLKNPFIGAGVKRQTDGVTAETRPCRVECGSVTRRSFAMKRSL